MLERDRIREIAEKIMTECPADEVEVVISSVDHYLTRYAQNHIHQNTGLTNTSITVRAVFGRRMGEASTNKTDDESLKEVAVTAAKLAEISPEDPNLLPRLGPQEYEEVNAYQDEPLSPMERARYVSKAIEMCKSRGLIAAGIFSNTRSCHAIANSKGLFAFHSSTRHIFSLSVMAEGNGAGWCERISRKLADIDPEEIAEIAIRKAEMSRNPREVPPGKYTVILEPEAVANLLSFLGFGFNALAVEEGWSPLRDKIGKRVFGENITISSDVYHPLHQETPFDAEGVPTKRVVLVERGVVKGLVYDRATAARKGVEPTGHGVDPRGAYGAHPRAIVVEGGEDSIEEMISSTERGILVTRFHYENLVDPMNLIVTGMTRDGTFMVEGGEVKFPIKNFRFNVSLFDVLNKVEMLSEPVYASGMVVPAMKISEFNFTSGTEF